MDTDKTLSYYTLIDDGHVRNEDRLEVFRHLTIDAKMIHKISQPELELQFLRRRIFALVDFPEASLIWTVLEQNRNAVFQACCSSFHERPHELLEPLESFVKDEHLLQVLETQFPQEVIWRDFLKGRNPSDTSQFSRSRTFKGTEKEHELIRGNIARFF